MMAAKGPSPGIDPVAQLCPACGLCCNGVIFADVRLQRSDDPARLAELGLPWKRRGQSFSAPQPCACFDGVHCTIYQERPQRCRAFECRLLQRVSRGETSAKAALRAIRQARRQVERVRKLLQQLGQTDENLPLSRRCAKVMAEPLDLAGDESVIQARSKLMIEVARLTHLLEKEFLTASV